MHILKILLFYDKKAKEIFTKKNSSKDATTNSWVLPDLARNLEDMSGKHQRYIQNNDRAFLSLVLDHSD